MFTNFLLYFYMTTYDRHIHQHGIQISLIPQQLSIRSFVLFHCCELFRYS